MIEKKYKKTVNGITLVALVITVILLLILAGVTLNLTLGENGLLKRVQLAKEDYENAKSKEKNDLDELYSSVMVATGEDSKITISVEDLRALIKKEVEESQSKMCSPILLTNTVLPHTGTNTRNAGTYKVSDNRYTRTDSEKIGEYLEYETGKGWKVKKSGLYFINTHMTHELSDALSQCRTRLFINGASLGAFLGSKYARTG